jgi:hypothetical protein
MDRSAHFLIFLIPSQPVFDLSPLMLHGEAVKTNFMVFGYFQYSIEKL